MVRFLGNWWKFGKNLYFYSDGNIIIISNYFYIINFNNLSMR